MRVTVTVGAELHAWVSKSWEGKPRWDRAGHTSKRLPSPGSEKGQTSPVPTSWGAWPSSKARYQPLDQHCRRDLQGAHGGICNKALRWSGESGKGPLRHRH